MIELNHNQQMGTPACGQRRLKRFRNSDSIAKNLCETDMGILMTRNFVSTMTKSAIHVQEAFEEYRRQCKELRCCLQNPNEYSEKLQPALLARNQLHLLLVAHPDTPPAVLEDISKVCTTNLLSSIADHPRTSGKLLRKLSTHSSSEVRLSVASNPHTPISSLVCLAADENPDVRYRLAERHHLPVSILEKLVADENPYVADRARRTLEFI